MRVGYARISTADQSPELQLEALRHADCEKVFTETVSGAKADRPELAHVLRDVLRQTCPGGSHAVLSDQGYGMAGTGPMDNRRGIRRRPVFSPRHGTALSDPGSVSRQGRHECSDWTRS